MSDVFDHLTALSDAARVRLLAVVSEEELTVGELAKVLQLPQSTLSRHVKALDAAGWLTRRAEGTASFIRRNEDLPEDARALWEAVAAPVRATARFAEDEARLQAVLTARIEEGRGFFGRVTAGWDQVRHELFGDALVTNSLLALLDPDLVVGDLGCGTGDALATLAPFVRRVIGVDREAGMLDVARARVEGHDNVELVIGLLSDLPLPDDALDAALCRLVLHHLHDVPSALAEAARVLKPGGRLVVLDMQAHDRTAYRATMGHVHLGFERDGLAAHAAKTGLSMVSWTDLAPDPEAQGPPLFVAVLRTQAT